MNSFPVGAYPAYSNKLILITERDNSASFRAPNACGFPIVKNVDIIEGLLETLVRGPILIVGRAVGAVRDLVACSRPRIHRAPDVDEARLMLKKPDSSDDKSHERYVEMRGMSKNPDSSDDKSHEGYIEMRGMSVECMRMRLELQAVLRHLEVRWQLFNEAMTKWCDLEAMLAICTDNVTWSGGRGTVFSGRNSPLLSEDLRSLLRRKLSYNVVIERITRLSPMVCPDLSLDKHGNCIKLEDSERRNTTASLDMLLGSYKKDVYNEDCWYKDVGPYMVLEKDNYSLQDTEGEIVEQGSRTVLWKQHNTTWYIRACFICPEKPSSLM